MHALKIFDNPELVSYLFRGFVAVSEKPAAAVSTLSTQAEEVNEKKKKR